mmetsp:Transcript_17005/g.47091  ORF Transcript_17005/g.47091 Transcript_17005/m.47091 type:complete len:234 (-) Transcript_17005:907-1608(-)
MHICTPQQGPHCQPRQPSHHGSQPPCSRSRPLCRISGAAPSWTQYLLPSNRTCPMPLLPAKPCASRSARELRRISCPLRASRMLPCCQGDGQVVAMRCNSSSCSSRSSSRTQKGGDSCAQEAACGRGLAREVEGCVQHPSLGPGAHQQRKAAASKRDAGRGDTEAAGGVRQALFRTRAAGHGGSGGARSVHGPGGLQCALHRSSSLLCQCAPLHAPHCKVCDGTSPAPASRMD